LLSILLSRFSQISGTYSIQSISIQQPHPKADVEIQTRIQLQISERWRLHPLSSRRWGERIGVELIHEIMKIQSDITLVHGNVDFVEAYLDWFTTDYRGTTHFLEPDWISGD